MKKLLSRKMGLVFGIVFILANPSFATEKEKGIVCDDFFLAYDTRCTIETLSEDEGKLTATVKAAKWNEARFDNFEPLQTTEWKFDDNSLKAEKTVHASLQCGEKVLKKDLVKKDIPYSYSGRTSYQIGDLENEGLVTFYSGSIFRRPDQSTLLTDESPTHQLERRTVRKPSHDVAVCIREWEIFSQWQSKIRHERNHYSSVDVYLVIVRTPIRFVYGGNNEPIIVSEQLLRKELTFKSHESESCECGDDGCEFPEGAIVI